MRKRGTARPLDRGREPTVWGKVCMARAFLVWNRSARAFEELVRTYGGRMRSAALRLTMNEAEAGQQVNLRGPVADALDAGQLCCHLGIVQIRQLMAIEAAVSHSCCQRSHGIQLGTGQAAGAVVVLRCDGHACSIKRVECRLDALPDGVGCLERDHLFGDHIEQIFGKHG